MVQIRVQNSIGNQFPTNVSSLFPGEQATAEVPYDSVAAVWSAFDHHETNKTLPVLAFKALRGFPLRPLRRRLVLSFCSPVTVIKVARTARSHLLTSGSLTPYGIPVP